MTEPRTVTLPTADHGDVTIPEPAWCIGHVSTPGDLRVDIIHSGPDVVLSFHGRDITEACLTQSPFASPSAPRLGGRTPGVSVTALALTLDPAGVYELAAAFDRYADGLRDLADQLAAVLAGDTE
ncbi:DUF6907 domain-containing protein [Streptomyces adustus]|uniref:DUF6907 domain-containing protein n=1 Tax=Streptomyces adustus TaxID=1609272 RepID=UPI003711A358